MPLPQPERVPNPKITPADSEAEVREDQLARLAAHYQEHQAGPMLVLLRGGHSELITTQQCPDCQRYGRWWDVRGTAAAHDILLEVFR